VNKPNQQTVREIARTAVSYVIRDNLVQAAMAEHGISADNVYAWSEIYDAVLDTIAASVQEPAEATGDEQQQPWPRAQRMPLAVAGGRPQPWHQQAIAEYRAATGIELKSNPTIPGGYTATQVNWAITWWNERAESEQAGEAAEGIVRFLTHFREDSDDTVIEGLERYRLTVGMLRAVLAERKALAAQIAELEAIVAEGNQRDRALALLLLRSGGKVEFSQVEQVTAPWHGQLISYPSLATGGLVLAYSADGETVGAAPQQPEPDGGGSKGEQ